MSWIISPDTGDYVMNNGAPTDTDDLKFPAYYRMKIKRQKWLYAPDSKYGSDFYKLQKNFTTKPQTALEKIAARALQPIVDDGRATNINIEVTGVSRSGVTIEADIGSGQATVSTLTLKGLGIV